MPKTADNGIYISDEGIDTSSPLNIAKVLTSALKDNNLVFPNFMNVTNTSLNTTVENEFGVKVSTIEHLMGALFGLGIDNALIEIDNEEVPILDGSAKEFIQKILLSGIKVSEAPIKIVKINKKIEYSEGERFISIKPSTLSLDIDFELKYQNKIIPGTLAKEKLGHTPRKIEETIQDTLKNFIDEGVVN